MTVELLDFSYDRLTPAQVKAAGRVGVIRYVASGRPGVTATRAEVDSYRTAGLTFTAVWQNGKTRALGGTAAGIADGRDAAAYTATLGAGSTDPVYFAVDFDAQPGDMAAVVDYFHGVASVLGWGRVGVYGGLPTLDHLRATTPVGLFWQTVAWSDGATAPYANLLQYATDQTITGARVDYDRALTTYYGQWWTMPLKSSPRTGAPVLWVVLHTAEGPYDGDPANPSIDPGSVDQLREFFADPNTEASSHAGCDDDRLSDGWVPYDRAAWTLRNGNSISDNLEMCGRAGWTRVQWLEHRPMIRNAAKWAASRCQARRIPARRLTAGQVAARTMTGIIDHNTYTQATGDGTHWDIGPGFPWDVFLADVATFMQGGTPEDDTMSAEDVTKLTTTVNAGVAAVRTEISGLYRILSDGTTSDGTISPAHRARSLQGLKEKADATAGDVAGLKTAMGMVQAAQTRQATELTSLRGDLETIRAAFADRLDHLANGGGGGPVVGDLQGTVTVHLTPAAPDPADGDSTP